MKGVNMLVFTGCVGALLIYAVWMYNLLIRGRVLIGEAWSGVDVQLKRRSDLVPRLVEVVKGYARHERITFENVAALRQQLTGVTDMAHRARVEGGLTGALRTIFAVGEAYPDLKADNNFLELQQALIQVEDDIQLARRYFNGTVREQNVRLESFPGNLIAGIFGFVRREFFELESATERTAPVVTALSK